ncbi:MAG TPA: hypothetical protein VIW94_05555 [Acidimicrobiia bacterium]
MDGLTRTVTSVVAGLVAFAGAFFYLMPAGCDDEGGVPSWERCTSLAGTPAFSFADFGLVNQFDILIPVIAFAMATSIVWLLLATAGSNGDRIG